MTLHSSWNTPKGDVEKRSHKATFLLPHEKLALSLTEPVRRYARPESQVKIAGRSSPQALIKLTQLTLQGSSESHQTPSIQTTADSSGFFKLNVPLNFDHNGQETSKAQVPQAGQVWSATIEASARGYLPSQVQLNIKRSHRPTWEEYTNGLSRRRDKAASRYRTFSQADLKLKSNEWLKEAGMIPGVIAWIDRGVSAQETSKTSDEERPQRLLVHTCQKNDGCPIWVEDPNAFWVQIGQKVHIFGVYVGVGRYPNAQGEIVEFPELKARLTTP